MTSPEDLTAEELYELLDQNPDAEEFTEAQLEAAKHD